MDVSTARRLAGQHFIVGFDGHEPPAALLAALRGWSLAGVIVFRRNIAGPEQLLDLARRVQTAAPDGAPLVIAIDQEGGKVSRLGPPFTQFAGARAAGALGSEEKARAFGLATARELAAVGVNVDFAPVLDVDTNPFNPIIGERAFSTNPQEVARLGVAFYEGLREGGVQGCGKHFPGHGGTSADSHLELPEVDDPLERLQSVEVLPFIHAMRAGLDLLMTAHVVYRRWDPASPASLSWRILTSFLRDDIRYEGLVVSDDLEMKAVSEMGTLGEVAERAIGAGSDLVLACRNWEAVEGALDHLSRAYASERLKPALLEQSAARVAALRARLLRPPEDGALIARWVGCDAHRRLAEEIAAGRPAV